MTLVRHGPPGLDHRLDPAGDGTHRGIGRLLTSASWPSVGFSCEDDADLIVEALRAFRGGRIGLVGVFSGPAVVAQRLWRALAEFDVVDAADCVDPMRAVKSSDEQVLIRRTAALQDAAMRAAFDAIRPGTTDGAIAAVAQFTAQQLGCEQGFFFCNSGPPGTPLFPAPRHFQNRVVERGDVVILLLETNGPGGYYTHLGRSAVVGPVPQAMRDEFEFAVGAQQFTIDRVRPGADPAEIWHAYNEYMREHGRPEEARLHCHGQGYDAVERPLIRHDETMPVTAGMNMGCHPNYFGPTGLTWLVDNFLVGDAGAERLHTFPREIVELDG
jgi:Xaa-Pro aminopeptidase